MSWTTIRSFKVMFRYGKRCEKLGRTSGLLPHMHIRANALRLREARLNRSDAIAALIEEPPEDADPYAVWRVQA